MDDGRDVIQSLMAPVLQWMSDGGDAWAMDISYWRTRSALLDRLNALGPEINTVLTELDVSLHRFEPSAERTRDQIDEQTLRAELAISIQRLRNLGALG